MLALDMRSERRPRSGDVHVAALGVIESTREGGQPCVINQLTSSGIVPPTSSAMEVFVLEFPAAGRCIKASRNFLTLQTDAAGGADRYWANGWVEGEPYLYTKVVHPLGASN